MTTWCPEISCSYHVLSKRGNSKWGMGIGVPLAWEKLVQHQRPWAAAQYYISLVLNEFPHDGSPNTPSSPPDRHLSGWKRPRRSDTHKTARRPRTLHCCFISTHPQYRTSHICGRARLHFFGGAPSFLFLSTTLKKSESFPKGGKIFEIPGV